MKNNVLHPYNSRIITQTILSKICFGNLSLRYGVENLKTGKCFKGLAALTLGYHVAENAIDAYKFATFDHLNQLHLQLIKGSKSIVVPLISKEITSMLTLTSGCFFGTHQLKGYVSESKPSFNLDLFYSKNNLSKSDLNFYSKLVDIIEGLTKELKYSDLIYNIVSAYLTDILSVNIPQKSCTEFLGKLNLAEIRQIALLSNQIVDDLFLDCRHHNCSAIESSFYLAQLKCLIKS